MSIPGATLVDIWSISEAALWFRDAAFLEVTMDFFAGVTENSFESGGIILTERATRSLLLQFINKKLEKFEFRHWSGSRTHQLQMIYSGRSNLPQCEDCLLGLQWLVVGKLNYVRDWGEQGLVHMDLGVGVDAVVADVKELDDLWFWELFDDALAGALIFNQLTGNLDNGMNKLC